MSDVTKRYVDRAIARLRQELLTRQPDGGGGGAHASSHENGGSDEISVAGLSGLLADAQTPLTHNHAATDITSGTLSTDRFSAYDDLSAESKIGTGAAQVAAGNHTHDYMAHQQTLARTLGA